MPVAAPSVATWGEFVALFPEYENLPRTRVERHLVLAEENVHPTTWEAKRKQGVMYLAAHTLAMSPTGESARLESDYGETTYGKVFQRMLSSVASGFRVT